MSKVKVFLNPWGGIEKYRFSHYVNPITATNPFGLEYWMDDERVDCEVFDADGAHVRDAVLDDRGNVGDFEGQFVLPPPNILDLREIVTPSGVRIPTEQINGPRVSVGYGNIFGEGFVMQGASEWPKKYQNMSSIGSFCTFGSGVVLNTERGFRIQDICIIGDSTEAHGRLTMSDRSRLGAGVVIAKAGSLCMGIRCRVGEGVRIVGSVHMEAGSIIGKDAWYKNHSYKYIPADTVVPEGYVHAGGDFRVVL